MPIERLLLKQASEQQEEHESGERVEEPVAAAAGDLGDAAAEQHHQAERDRHLERDRRARGRACQAVRK